MNMKKILAAFLALMVCLAVPMTALAATVRTNDGIALFAEDESSTDEASTEEVSAEETSTEEAVTAEETTEEAATEEKTTAEATTEEPTKNDVIALIIKFLGTIKLDEVKDALNDINEALGLPRIETFADIAAYADALYEKLEDMGLGYDEIINAIQSSDFIEWINGLIFGKNDVVTTTAVADDDADETTAADDSDNSNPHTGVALAASGAAAATLIVSSALAYVLRKRNAEEE